MKYVLDCKNWSIEESSNNKKRTFYRDKKKSVVYVDIKEKVFWKSVLTRQADILKGSNPVSKYNKRLS